MLLRFAASNYQSIRHYTELSLVASNAIKDRPEVLIDAGDGYPRLLPVSMIYGANASGKSAVYQTMGVMQWHIKNSFSGRGPTAKMGRDVFALNKACKLEPTVFDCDFVIDNVRYHYGFSFDEDKYKTEYLFYFVENNRRSLFERIEGERIKFGKTLRGRNKLVEDVTRDNSLFLSAAAQNSHPLLTKIYQFFVENIISIGVNVSDSDIQQEIYKGRDERLVPFLRDADTGISGLKYHEKTVGKEQQRFHLSFRQFLIDELGDVIKDNPLGELIPEIPEPPRSVTFTHVGQGGKHHELPFSKESRGTRRIASIALHCFKALDAGSIVFIDEIDASLHTLLTIKLVELFQDKSINLHGAQLIATTHDTNILSSQLLRRDQVWFVEKDNEGSTSLFPLTDIKTRNTDNFEKGYLQGRYGAIPYFGRVDSLLGI